MRTRMRSHLVLFGIALLGCWTVACGSGSGSIASPSGGPAGLGATIEGTVTTGSGGSGSQGFGAALPSSVVRVSVQGSSQSTSTDGKGRFTLAGLRAGDVTLRFQASGVDARLSVGGLLDGQVLTINVRASGNDAQLVSGLSDDSSEGDEREFTGLVESVTPPTLMVSGITVQTDAGTEIKRGNLRIALAEIQVGETAKVEGAPLADGSVRAREIKVSGGSGQGPEVQFSGVVDAVAPPSMVVDGRSVLTDSNTKFTGKGHIDSVADFDVGDVVEVEALQSTTGALLAREIKRLETASDDDQDDDDDGDDDGGGGDDDNSGSGS